MSLVHLRLGPNKPGVLGFIVPLLDAFKLLTKTCYIPVSSNFYPYILAPGLSLSLSLFLWYLLPSIYFSKSVSFSILLFLLVTSFIIYPLLVSGWASNRKYSLVGCLRAIAQSISYEAVMSTLVVVILLVSMTYSIRRVSFASFFLLPILPLWGFSVLAETHRAPFDFSERESELVSGFNTEYGGGIFALIFLAEYSALLVSSFIIVYFFIGGISFPFLNMSRVSIRRVFFLFKFILVIILFILVRVTYCRFRYDLLIIAAWKSFLPVSLLMLSLYTIFL